MAEISMRVHYDAAAEHSPAAVPPAGFSYSTSAHGSTTHNTAASELVRQLAAADRYSSDTSNHDVGSSAEAGVTVMAPLLGGGDDTTAHHRVSQLEEENRVLRQMLHRLDGGRVRDGLAATPHDKLITAHEKLQAELRREREARRVAQSVLAETKDMHAVYMRRREAEVKRCQTENANLQRELDLTKHALHEARVLCETLSTKVKSQQLELEQHGAAEQKVLHQQQQRSGSQMALPDYLSKSSRRAFSGALRTTPAATPAPPPPASGVAVSVAVRSVSMSSAQGPARLSAVPLPPPVVPQSGTTSTAAVAAQSTGGSPTTAAPPAVAVPSSSSVLSPRTSGRVAFPATAAPAQRPPTTSAAAPATFATSSAAGPLSTAAAAGQERSRSPYANIAPNRLGRRSTSPTHHTSRLEVRLGARVTWRTHQAVVRFLGAVPILGSGDWCGLELLAPVGSGEHSGSFAGIRYFDTATPGTGIFCRPAELCAPRFVELQQRALSPRGSPPPPGASTAGTIGLATTARQRVIAETAANRRRDELARQHALELVERRRNYTGTGASTQPSQPSQSAATTSGVQATMTPLRSASTGGVVAVEEPVTSRPVSYASYEHTLSQQLVDVPAPGAAVVVAVDTPVAALERQHSDRATPRMLSGEQAGASAGFDVQVSATTRATTAVPLSPARHTGRSNSDPLAATATGISNSNINIESAAAAGVDGPQCDPTEPQINLPPSLEPSHAAE